MSLDKLNAGDAGQLRDLAGRVAHATGTARRTAEIEGKSSPASWRLLCVAVAGDAFAAALAELAGWIEANR